MTITSESSPFPGASVSGMDHQAGGLGSASLSNAEDKPAPAAAVDLMNRVVQGAHETLDRLAQSAAPQVQRLADGMAHADDALHAQAGQLRQTRDAWADSLRHTVRENPLATVAVALALGALIARVTR